MKLPVFFASLIRLIVVLGILTGGILFVPSPGNNNLALALGEPPDPSESELPPTTLIQEPTTTVPEDEVDLQAQLAMVEQAKQEGPESVIALLDVLQGEALDLAMEEIVQAMAQLELQDRSPDPVSQPNNPDAPPLTVGGGCTYATISAAIAAASPGNTVLIEGGVSFPENLVIDKDLTLQGGYSGCNSGSTDRSTVDGWTLTGTLLEISNGQVTLRELRIVDGSGAFSGGGIELSSGAEVILDHVDVLGNSASFGGGVYINAGTVMTATNDSWIASNTATYTGGGVRVFGTFSAEQRSDIDDNYAADGGGIGAYGGIVTLDETWLRYNQTTGGDGKGGGIYAINGSTVNVTNSSSVSANVAYDGAGIYADDSMVNVQIGFFHTNTAANDGGGMHLTGNTTLDGSAFRIGGEDAVLGNHALRGAGIYAIDSSIDLSGGQVYANIAETSGAGIYADNTTINLDEVTIGLPSGDRPNQLGINGNEGVGIYMTNRTTATLNESTVSGNLFQTTGYTFGGGIYAKENSTLVLENNSRVEYNIAPSSTLGRGGGIYAYNATITVDNSQVVSNTAGTNGGGIRLYDDCVLNLQNNAVVSYNQAENQEGGGIASSGPNEINISDTTMQGNQAGTDGGAIFLDDGTLDLTGWWDLRWNIAAGNGGGVAVTNAGDADFEVTSGVNPSFLAVNTATGGGGGGLYLNNRDTVNLHATAGHKLNFNTNGASSGGGAAFIDNGGTLHLLGWVEMTSNHTDGNGGAFYLDNESQLQIVSSGSDQPQVMVNWADNGGGIYALGGSIVTCSGAVFGSGVYGNRADLTSGGALYLDASTLQAYNCTFHNNQAVMHGGAIASYDSVVTIDADYSACDPFSEPCSSFYGNVAVSGNGGAFYNYEGDFILNHTVLHDNNAQLGGAIYQTGTSAWGEVKDSLFYRNTTSGASGSAIRVYQGNFYVWQTTLGNNTGAPAFSSESTGTVEVFNNIAWDNTNGFVGTVFSDYGCNIDQSSNVGIATNPLWVDPGVGDDYHLSAGSPAIDACLDGLPLDLDGTSRPINGLYDMGAFEFLYHIFLPLVLR